MDDFKVYRSKEVVELRPYIVGENLGDNVVISWSDLNNGSPMLGDMIARNPKKHEHSWLISEDYFNKKLELIIE
jgi:hypothetical protein